MDDARESWKMFKDTLTMIDFFNRTLRRSRQGRTMVDIDRSRNRKGFLLLARVTLSSAFCVILFLFGVLLFAGSSLLPLFLITMATRDPYPPPGPEDAEFTTNEEDQREAAKLKARLEEQRQKAQVTSSKQEFHATVPSVQIAPGAHKYVLIHAKRPSLNDDKGEYFVISKRGASYHRNAAQPLIEQLKQAGYNDIRVKGGGRISRDDDAKEISVYGFSYSCMCIGALPKCIIWIGCN